MEFALYQSEEPDTRFYALEERLARLEVVRKTDVEANKNMRENFTK